MKRVSKNVIVVIILFSLLFSMGEFGYTIAKTLQYEEQSPCGCQCLTCLADTNSNLRKEICLVANGHHSHRTVPGLAIVNCAGSKQIVLVPLLLQVLPGYSEIAPIDNSYENQYLFLTQLFNDTEYFSNLLKPPRSQFRSS